VAAVAMLALAAAVVGALWVRRVDPPPAVPAVGGSLAQEIVGVWQGNGSPFTATVFHADGTQVLFKSPEGVLNPGDTETAHYRVSGDTLEITIPDPRARSCLFTYSGQRLGEGRVEVTAVGQTGLGCLPEPLAAPFTIVRISPVSPAGLAYSRPTDNTLTTVASLNSVRGTWLLKGTGVVLAIGQISITTGIGYRIDHEGTIDYGADDQGTPTVSGPGRIGLASDNPGGCKDTTLDNVAAGDYSFTATVTADPCNLFAGQTLLTWIRIQ
jgi:hypothetical protein